MNRSRSGDAAGFTLTELLVAITILGIIIVAIGAMITTGFRTSTIASAQLQGSRGPKTMSRYWVPDVEQADTVDTGVACGPGDAIVTFVSPNLASAFDDRDPDLVGPARTVTWRVETLGTRDQLVRYVCDADPAPSRLVVVADLEGTPTVSNDGRRHTIEVTVPDRSRADKEYTFSVTGTSQLTTTTSVP